MRKTSTKERMGLSEILRRRFASVRASNIPWRYEKLLALKLVNKTRHVREFALGALPGNGPTREPSGRVWNYGMRWLMSRIIRQGNAARIRGLTRVNTPDSSNSNPGQRHREPQITLSDHNCTPRSNSRNSKHLGEWRIPINIRSHKWLSIETLMITLLPQRSRQPSGSPWKDAFNQFHTSFNAFENLWSCSCEPHNKKLRFDPSGSVLLSVDKVAESVTQQNSANRYPLHKYSSIIELQITFTLRASMAPECIHPPRTRMPAASTLDRWEHLFIFDTREDHRKKHPFARMDGFIEVGYSVPRVSPVYRYRPHKAPIPRAKWRAAS